MDFRVIRLYVNFFENSISIYCFDKKLPFKEQNSFQFKEQHIYLLI